MNADIQYWKDTINSDIESIRSALSRAPRISDDLEKRATLEDADKKIRTVKKNTRSFKAEIRLEPDADARTRYKKELTHFEETIAQLSADIKNLQHEGDRQQIFLGANTDNNELGPEATGDALLNEAERLQDKTQTKLSNTKVMIEESKQVGMMTVEELQRQRDQIQNIDGDVMRMEDNLERADKLIKTFGKRMATDKLIQCFACVNILLIVAVVVYAVVKGGLNNSKDEGVPQSPLANNGDNASPTRFLRGALGLS